MVYAHHNNDILKGGVRVVTLLVQHAVGPSWPPNLMHGTVVQYAAFLYTTESAVFLYAVQYCIAVVGAHVCGSGVCVLCASCLHSETVCASE